MKFRVACLFAVVAAVASMSHVATEHLSGQLNHLVNQSQASVQAAERAFAVRGAIRHVWDGYINSKAGEVLADEVRPLTGQPGGSWGGIGMELWEMLDTLWLAGEHDAFEQGEQMAHKPLGYFNKLQAGRTSTFELTIRALGGLLSAHALSGKPVFLERARELADRLLHAFPEHRSVAYTPFPAAYINVHQPGDIELTASWLGQQTSLADVGSTQLEFGELSSASGNLSFQKPADSVMTRLAQLSRRSGRPLLTPLLRIEDLTSNLQGPRTISVGAMADSYFEYLLKRYLQSGLEDVHSLELWKQAMNDMRRGLLCKSGGHTFVAMDGLQDGGGAQAKLTPNCDKGMDHISCFVGGMLALASHEVPQHLSEDWWLPTGKAITKTCYEMYRRSPSGIAAESALLEDGEITPNDRSFRLRPETLESIFYLYRVTGDQMYRDWSWQIFAAINKHTRSKYGFAAVLDVTKVPVSLKDSEETFMGAETLKYALLTQLPKEALSLDDFVLNTEAHPLPRRKAKASHEPRTSLRKPSVRQ